MADDRAKWRLADGIAELEREEHSRARSYPTLIGRSVISDVEANNFNWALHGTLTFLLFCKEHEPQFREFMIQVLKAKAAAATQGEPT